MPIGSSTGLTRTADYTLTRDKMIELAHKYIGVLEQGQTMDADMLNDGIELLNLIVRETDGAGKWRWTIDASVSIPLAANVAIYTALNGLPSNVAEPVSASYRDKSGRDTPIKLLQAENYEEICEKDETGDPRAVYIDEHITLSSRTMRVWPMLGTVTTQSNVVGTDAVAYQCVMAHTGAAVNRPTTGANWKMYWQQGGASATTWVSGTAYTAPEQIRLLYRRPVYDFDTYDQTPDFPIQWPRLMVYKLAFDLGDIYGVPLDQRTHMVQKAKGSFDDIFRSTKGKSTDVHHKATYF